MSMLWIAIGARLSADGGLDCCVGASNKVDVGAVLSAGRPLALDLEVTLPDFGPFRFPDPAHAVLEVSPLGGGIGVDGFIDVTWSGACDRCVEEVKGQLHLEVDEQFETLTTPHPFADNNVLEGQLFDVEDLARQLVDSSLPLSVLCSEDCPGLCQECGNRRDAGCTCSATVER
jgi:hypothetical protein